jgi:hypothetical protein
MTYTTVYKDYEAPTLAEAAEKMLLDQEVFEQEHTLDNPGDGNCTRYDAGAPKGYSVESWEWTKGRLRVRFR